MSEWVVVAVFFLIAVIHWVTNMLKEQAQKRQAEERIQDRTASPEGQLAAKASRLEDWAAQRKAQLEELMRRRRTSQQQSRSDPVSQGQPSNLTLGQAEERVRAKAAYERRAEALRTDQRTPPQQPEARTTTPGQTRKVTLPASLDNRISRRHLPKKASRVAPDPGSHGLGAGVTQVDTTGHDPDSTSVHRLVQDVAFQPSTRSRKVPVKLLRMSLRDAIVVKEILDEPISLRDASSVLGLQ